MSEAMRDAAEARYRFYEAAKTEAYGLSSRTNQAGVPLLQRGAINIYAMIPCPLRPRFNREFQAFVENYNAAHEAPLYCPSLAGLDHDEVDEILKTTDKEEDLPEVFVAAGTHWAFCGNFRRRFIDTGVFEPYTPPGFDDAMPATWKDIARSYKLGFLAFGGWGLIRDLSRGACGSVPKTWLDLARPEFRGEISVHGCDGNPGCTSLLQLLKEQGGVEALAGFARNVKAVKHFSQMLKSMDSNDTERTVFNILPHAAAGQIPSNKRAVRVELEDGLLFAPMTIFVKKNRPAGIEEALSFFYSRVFRDILARGDFTLVDEMDWSRKYTFPDWQNIVARDYGELADELLREYGGYRTGGRVEIPAFSACPL